MLQNEPLFYGGEDSFRLAFAYSIVKCKPRSLTIPEFIEKLQSRWNTKKQVNEPREQEQVHQQRKAMAICNVVDIIDIKDKRQEELAENLDELQLQWIEKYFEKCRRTLQVNHVIRTFCALDRFLSNFGNPKMIELEDEGSDQLVARATQSISDIFLHLRFPKNTLVGDKLAETAMGVIDLLLPMHKHMVQQANFGKSTKPYVNRLNMYKHILQNILIFLNENSPALAKILQYITQCIHNCYEKCTQEADIDTRLYLNEAFLSFSDILFPCMHSNDAQVANVAKQFSDELGNLLTINNPLSGIISFGLKEMLDG
ncbi:meiotic recombination protein Rec24 [Schizosaccharomyces japonicus yFS275]|uniref:Meiotic recombination protein Rec24 n=1 Tax=Schizosaccharomyces japonicus (strain yFS275 / FY16936) TaxID=402676 RepID=B6K2M3_SCHJY|nr:meiotic recombination protein Rec24 [Schizosaccharomyces japonicus yFS275]EEB07404.1 meiotic recombination protein Rec24 [Schizosaccharomyces japonicus yFS275]